MSLLDLAMRVLDAVEGDESVEAFAMRSDEHDIKVREGEVESLASATTRGVGIRVLLDGRQGFAATADVSDDGLRRALADARDNAAAAEPDPANALPEPSEPPRLDGLVDPGFDGVTADDRIDLALSLERAARRADARVAGVDTVAYADGRRRWAIASTTGLRLEAEATDAFAYAFVLARDDDETQTGFGLTLGRGLGDLDPEAAGAEAARHAARLLGARPPRSRRAPVVFGPFVTAQFLSVLAQALSGEAVVKRRSVFADRVGADVGSSAVTLVDDGVLDGAPGTRPFDGEGVPQQRTTVVDGGRLDGFLHSTWTAGRMGDRSTGNAARGGYGSSPGVGPTNLFLQPGERSADDLVAGIDDGVYVQDVMGLHSGADPISGDFSVSFSGLAIRDGELADPIREAAVASTIPEVLSAVAAVATDLRFFPVAGSVGGSTVLIREMAVSGPQE